MNLKLQTIVPFADNYVDKTLSIDERVRAINADKEQINDWVSQVE